MFVLSLFHSSSSSVLSSLARKSPFRSQPSPHRHSTGNNVHHMENKNSAEQRLPLHKERLRVYPAANSTAYPNGKHSDFTHTAASPHMANHDLSHRKTAKNRRRASSDVEASWNHTTANGSKDGIPFIKNLELDPIIVDPPDGVLPTPSIEELDPAARIKLPKGKRKSKASSSSKREEREARRAQSKMARKEESLREPADRDDSSSTTTECSNADSEQSDKVTKVSLITVCTCYT